LGLDLQQRHGFGLSLMSKASATLQTVEIAYISGKRKYSRRRAAPSPEERPRPASEGKYVDCCFRHIFLGFIRQFGAFHAFGSRVELHPGVLLQFMAAVIEA